MGQKILSHTRYYESQIKNIDFWKVSDEEKKKVREYVKAYETGKITGRIGSNPQALIERLLDFQKVSLEHIKKDVPNRNDVENFFDSLIKNKIRAYSKKTKKYNGKPYSLKTKKSIVDTLAKYYKYKFPNNPELIEPLRIKLNSKENDYPYLTPGEIDKLYKNCKSDEERYFIAVMFASGCRIEEFLNIRYSDIELPKGEDNFVRLRLRTEFSKTKGRTISLYYSNSLEAVREYLRQREMEGIKPEDPIYSKRYGAITDWLRNLSKRSLNKNVTCHQLRHSSATWLASRFNRQQLCVFFGWQFSSTMPDKYISRNGVDMKEPDNSFNATEMEELKRQLEKERFERKITQEEIRTTQGEIKDITSQINPLIELLVKTIKEKKKLKIKLTETESEFLKAHLR